MKTRILRNVLNLVLIINFLLLTNITCVAQSGVAINTTGAAADASAIFDASSTNSGLLIPRMNKADRNDILQPAEGLLIYQVDDTTGFWYYNSGWKQIASSAGSGLSTGSIKGNTLYWNGSQWLESSNIYNAGGSVGINTNSPDSSAAIDISSTTKGALIPRLTTIQRNAINNVAEGLQIYNKDNKCFEFYDGNNWLIISCGCTSIDKPDKAVCDIFETQIEWAWTSVTNAAGYKYNTVNNFFTAIDNGLNRSFMQTGLTCNMPYNLYVWAYNACGNMSATSILTQSTSVCASSDCGLVTFNYNNNQVTYGTVHGNYNNGQYCWLDRNLGALRVATAHDDSKSYGDLFQWGRLDDGHQVRIPISGTTTISSSITNPGHSNFIIGQDNWYNGANPNNLWQGVSGINNPCPSGWRLPTETELFNERSTWSNYNIYGAFSSNLKLPSSSYRNYSNGIIGGGGNAADYWSSTTDGTTLSRSLYCTVNFADMYSDDRAYGESVRCIKN